MSIGYVESLRILHRAFRNYPASHRIHMLIRFLSCPFARFIDDVPAGARVLDVGAGHALFSYLLAEARAREVVAVEPDLRKSLLPSPSKNVRKVAGYDDCIRGTFDATVIVDVTYRMPVDIRRTLFTHVFERLAPGGVFVWKDMDTSRRWKMRWARFQEWLNDKFLGVTLGEGFVHQSRADVEAMLREIGFTGFNARAIDRGYPHPHIVYTALKPE